MKFKLVEDWDRLEEDFIPLNWQEEADIQDVVERCYECKRTSKAKIIVGSDAIRTLAKENGLDASCRINEIQDPQLKDIIKRYGIFTVLPGVESTSRIKKK